jgi:DNA polymerase I-like protein with 3'-5' exonuclease and polymerase domains
MLVTSSNFSAVMKKISEEKFVGFDTETYGAHFEDRLFSLILATAEGAFYFNYNDQPDHLGAFADTVLPRDSLYELESLLLDPVKLWIAHNAKFDIQKLRLEGLPYPTNIHCTYVTERIIRNDQLDLSLEAVAKKYGMAKDMQVDAYITKHKLYTQVEIPGKDRREKVPHYNLVPFEMMKTYGENDAILHREIGIKQLATL